MSEPQLPSEIGKSIVERLMSLDTPVAKRTLELALMLLLMSASGYLSEHTRDSQVQMGAMAVFMFTFLAAFFLGLKLMFMVMEDWPSSKKPKDSDQKAPEPQ